MLNDDIYSNFLFLLKYTIYKYYNLQFINTKYSIHNYYKCINNRLKISSSAVPSLKDDSKGELRRIIFYKITEKWGIFNEI